MHTFASPSAKLPRVIWLLGALLPIAAALAASARYVKQTADETYVRRDTFAIIQAGAEARQHAQDALQHELITKVDSANVRLEQIICGRRVQEGCR